MKEGTIIQATTGTVCEVKSDPSGYGRHVRILTDANINGDYYELTFGHLRDIFVPLGWKTKDYDPIGSMGNTGFVISGSTPFWGNAPAGRGVHLHFGIRECSTKDTGWITTYSSGMKAFVKNYDNGFKGSVDPYPFLQEWLLDNLTKQVSVLQKLVELWKQITLLK